MMNETGNYPGQAWLWLCTFWYQIEPFKSSDNADALIWGLMALLSVGLMLVPFIPGVRSVPRKAPVVEGHAGLGRSQLAVHIDQLGVWLVEGSADPGRRSDGASP